MAQARVGLLASMDVVGTAAALVHTSPVIDRTTFRAPLILSVRGEDKGAAVTTPTVDAKVEHSVDGVNFVAVGTAFAITQITVLPGNAFILNAATVGLHRYLKITITVSAAAFESGIRVLASLHEQ